MNSCHSAADADRVGIVTSGRIQIRTPPATTASAGNDVQDYDQKSNDEETHLVLHTLEKRYSS